MRMKLLFVPDVKPPSGKQIFNKEKIAVFKELGSEESGGQWALPDGREMVNKQVMRNFSYSTPRESRQCVMLY